MSLSYIYPLASSCQTLNVSFNRPTPSSSSPSCICSRLLLRSQTNIEYFIESAFHPPPFPIIRLWHFQYPSLLDNTWISSPLRLCRQHHHLFLSLSYIAPDVAYPDSDAGLWCNEQIVQRWVWQIRRYATVHPTYTTVCDAPRRSHHVNLTHPSYPCRYSCKPLWNIYLPLCTRSRCTWINVPRMEISQSCQPLWVVQPLGWPGIHSVWPHMLDHTWN